jgi:uncharacterized protein YbjT (DUF2867 family)
MPRILVIGATGTVGGQVLHQLRTAGIDARGLSRTPQITQFFVAGDLTHPETLDPALDGVDAVFLVWTAPPAAFGPALEKISKYAKRLVLLTSPHQTQHPLFQQPNALRNVHAEMERQIIATPGIQWTFLRPGMFAANALSWWGPQIRSGSNVVRWPFADTPTAPIHEADIAAVAVRALLQDGHASAEYMLTGPQSLTQAEQVEIIGRAIGRSLRMENIPPDQAREELRSVLPPPAISMLMDAWAAALGQPAYVTSTVTDVTGVPARTFLDWATDHSTAF